MEKKLNMDKFKLAVIETYKAEALIKEIRTHLKDYSIEQLDELCDTALFFLYTNSFDAYE